MRGEENWTRRAAFAVLPSYPRARGTKHSRTVCACIVDEPSPIPGSEHVSNRFVTGSGRAIPASEKRTARKHVQMGFIPALRGAA